MSPPKSTPMIKQYLAIKEEYHDAILFYRMGDFYEMFFEDAEIASRALEITLTSRNKNVESPIPMCGIPHRAARNYIGRLIDQGYKVAICDQVEDPATAKGLVKREVVRVITPGMIIDNEYLDERSNNFIVAINGHGAIVGLAYLDISTGDFRVVESKMEAIVDEARRLDPREILISESSRNNSAYSILFSTFSEVATTYLEDRVFEHRNSYERLTRQFQTLTLEGFGCEHLKAATQSAGALLSYVRDTQKQKIEHITRLETCSLEKFLLVDELSRQNLELTRNIRTGSRSGTLLSIIDRTMTAMGARLLKTWMRNPLVDAQGINLRQEAVAETQKAMQLRREIRERLKSVYDLERVGSKILMGQANARDLLALKRSLFMLPDIWSLLSETESALFQYEESTDNLMDLAALIEKAIREDAPPTVNEGGLIKTGFNPELDELVTISRDARQWLAQLEVRERDASGINALKVSYNKIFGYYIEVPKSRAESVPAHYVRKQTLVNAERYITDELKTFESKVLGAQDQRSIQEFEIFNEIRAEVVSRNKNIQSVAQFLARLDCLTNLAEIADQNDYCRPEITSDGIIRIEDGRHPVVEKMITAERFVPNSITMDDDENQILIITGPNMAGKSTVLRQLALLVIMAQMGSYIPARRASISMTDRIFTRVGALDNLSHGQSTFMVEMEETANILNNATPRSLVIMDEIGRGTSTFDGLSIAWAVAEYLHDLHTTGVKTLFATHYHELTEMADTKQRVKNFNIAVKEWNDEIIFLRKLVEGGTNRSYGIQVARLAGIPIQVIKRAKRILYTIENEEHAIDGSLPAETSLESGLTGPVQLDLFRKPENPVINKLKTLDILNLTPMEAMNYLGEFQEMLKEPKG